MVGVLFFAVFGHAATPVEQHMCWKRECILGQPEVVFAASLHVHPIATWVCQVKLLI